MKRATLSLKELLAIQHSIILAPMFLISNTAMVKAAIDSGITAAIPALNYRTTEDLRIAIREIKSHTKGAFGINLIVNKSNFLYKDQLDVCCSEKISFIITSLGSPKEVIEKAHAEGILVFCDVTDLSYAIKVEAMGADALIAVNKEAGGHSGTLSFRELIPLLRDACSIPIISAGGIGTAEEYNSILSLGASGAAIGSLFIASDESPVSVEYKQACIDYGAKDIVMTTKLSGTPCTVIKTPYVEQIGTNQNCIERLINKNKRLKKWMKALTFLKGMKSLEKAAFSTTYKNVWCAGPSIEHVREIRPIREIVASLVKGL